MNRNPFLLTFTAACALVLPPRAAGPLRSESAQPVWPPPGTNWPPAFGGDDSLPGGTVAHREPFEPENQDKLNEALAILKECDPAAHAWIEEAYQLLAINFVEIDNSVNVGGETTNGQVDSNTMGLELDGRSAEEIAGTISHEWTHRYNWANDPSYLDDLDCAEADGSAAQMMLLCKMLCDEDLSVECKEWRRVTDDYLEHAEKCMAAGGTPTPPPGDGCEPDSPPPCPCEGDW